MSVHSDNSERMLIFAFSYKAKDNSSLLAKMSSVGPPKNQVDTIKSVPSFLQVEVLSSLLNEKFKFEDLKINQSLYFFHVIQN